MKTRLKVTGFLLAALIGIELVSAAIAAEVQPPAKRSRADIEKVLAKAPQPIAIDRLDRLNIVLVACKKDHGLNEHDYPLWQKRWSLLFGGKGAGDVNELQVNLYGPPVACRPEEILAGAPKVSVTTADEWPSKDQFKSADLIVMNSWGRWNEQKIKDLETYLVRGGGFVSVHPALITNKELSEKLAKLLGLAWEDKYTGFRYGQMELKITDPNHPICIGLSEKINFLDEAYWPLKGDVNNITVLGTSDEKIAKDSDKTKAEPMFWTYQYGKGRVFGCILGHYTWTFDDPYLRILLFRGMAWAAGQSPCRFDTLVLRGAGVD